MRILTCPKLEYRRLLFSPDGRHLAAIGWSAVTDSIAPVWAIHGNTQPLFQLSNSDRRRPHLADVVFSPDGRRVLVRHETGWRGYILDTGEEIAEPELSEFRPHAVSENGQWAVRYEYPETDLGDVRVVAAENDGVCWMTRWTRRVRFPRLLEVTADAEGWQGVAGCLLTSDGSRLVLLFETEGPHSKSAVTVRLIETATGADVCEWQGSLPDSTYLKAISHQNHAVLFDGQTTTFQAIDLGTSDSTPLTRASTSMMQFTDATFSPDGRWLATTTSDTTVVLWDTTTWQQVRRFAWKIGRLRAVAFAPDGLTCAAGSDTGKVVLFDVDV